MSDEIYELNGLNKLQYRIVRGAKPGTKNGVSSARIQVVTDSMYDSQSPKEYLLEASFEANVVTGTAQFTNGSNLVTSTGTTTFSSLQPGDKIQAAGVETLYTIALVQSSTAIRLTSNFGGSSGNKEFLAQKVIVPNAKYQFAPSTDVEPKFEYSTDTGKWSLINGGELGIPKNTSASPLLMDDGISISWKYDSEDGKNDLQVIGNVTGKKLPTLASVSPSVALSPIPYPADHSTLFVKRKLPNSPAFTPLQYGVDFVVNYDRSPIFRYPYPPFPLRSSAMLMFLESHTQDQTVSPSFGGQIFLKKSSGVAVSNIMPTIEHLGEEIPGLSVTVGGSQLTEGVDYLANTSSGVVTFTTTSIDESPVESVLYVDNLLQSGLTVQRGSGTLESPDFSDPTDMVLGTDFSLNLSNGSFMFFEGLKDGELVRFQYLVEGQPIKEVKESNITNRGENVTDLRADRFPIIQGTVSLSRRSKNGYEPLSEGTDFNVSYMTGVIDILDGGTADGGYFMEYTPASTMEVLVAPAREGDYAYDIKIIDDPIFSISLDKYVLRVVNPSVSVSNGSSYLSPLLVGNIESVKTLDREGSGGTVISGESLNLTNAEFSDANRLLTLDGSVNTVKLRNKQVLLATYKYNGFRLPYSPVVTIQHISPSGGSTFEIEGRDLTGTIYPDGILRAFTRDTREFFYFKIKGVDLSGGINTKVSIYGSFPSDLRDASLAISDSPVLFGSETYTILPVAKNNNTITFTSDMSSTLRVGKLISIGDSQVYSVSSFVLSEDGQSTIATVSPSVSVSVFSGDPLLDRAKVSSKVLFSEGDNGVVTDSPILGTALSALRVRLSDAYSDSDNAYATIYIDDASIVLTQTVGSDTTEFAPIAYKELGGIQDIIDAIESLPTDSSTKSFAVEWIVPHGTDLRKERLLTTLSEPDPVRPLPYDLKVSPQILRKREGESEYSLLEQGASVGNGDYALVNGVVVLSSFILRGDRYKMTYQGLDLLRDKVGEQISMAAKYFVSMPKGTQFVVSMNYLNPDQWYVQGMTEADFLSLVAIPKIEEMVSQRKGAPTQGVENNLPPDQGNAAGGVQDNYYLLRDEQIKLAVYRQIYQYYTDRMATFAREVRSIKGHNLGNNEFYGSESDVRYNLTTQEDIDHHCTFGVSALMPMGWDKPYLRKDARFERQYLSYGEVGFYNYDGKGYVAGDNPEWESRNIFPGDQIRPYRTDTWYTIESVVNDDTLILATEVSGLGLSYVFWNPLTEELNQVVFNNLVPQVGPVPKKGFRYEVKRQEAPAYPLEDETGFLGARAAGSKSGPISLSYTPTDILTDSNVFVVEWSEDYSATWNTVTVDFTGLSFPASLQAIQGALLADEGFRSNFKADVELFYDSSINISGTTSATWPIRLPSLNDYVGVKEGLVIRANRKEMWFRFPEPTTTYNLPFVGDVEVSKDASKALGFPRGWTDDDGVPQGIWFFPGYSPFNADQYTEWEQQDRDTQGDLIEEMLEESYKLYRSSSGYKSRWSAVCLSIRERILGEQAALTSALEQAQAISIEDSASPAIITSYEDAQLAIAEYQRLISDNNAAYDYNESLIEAANSSFDTFTWTFERTTNGRDALAASLKAGTAGQLNVTATRPAAADPRVMYGVGGNVTNNYVVDGASVSLAPAYVNVNTIGAFTTLVKGSWNSSTVPATAFSVVSFSPVAYTLEVAGDTLSLSYLTITYNFDLMVYTTVSTLVNAINAQTAGQYTAAVLGGQGSLETLYLVRASYVSDGVTPLVPTFASLPYSNSATYILVMDSAFSLAPASPTGQEYAISRTELTLYVGGVPQTLNFSSHATLGSLMGAINALPGWSASSVSTTSLTYRYGTLGEVDRVAISASTPVRYGVKSDIAFYQVSDANLDSVVEYLGDRDTDLSSNRDFYTLREQQNKTSVGPDGEDLKDNRNLWLDRIVYRGEGPCTTIKSYKQRLEEEEE